MIAKVKVAPRERWCDYYRNLHVGPALTPGSVIEILPASCAVDPPELELETHPPGSRWWRLPGRFVSETEETPERCWICEHILEID